jgi:hypothetical protein
MPDEAARCLAWNCSPCLPAESKVASNGVPGRAYGTVSLPRSVRPPAGRAHLSKLPDLPGQAVPGQERPAAERPARVTLSVIHGLAAGLPRCATTCVYKMTGDADRVKLNA